MRKTIFNKKLIAGFLISLGIFLVFFYFLKNRNSSSETRYIFSQVKRGEISLTLSSTGTVVSKEEVDLKTKASGEIIYLNMKEGQLVKKGELLLKIDTSDQEKTIKDLENDLESAKINLSKTKKTTVVDEKNLKNQALNGFDQTLNDWKNYLDEFEKIFKVDISSYRLNSGLYLLDYYASIVNFYFPNDISYRETLWKNYEILKSQYQIFSNLISYLNSDSSLEEIKRNLDDFIDQVKILNDTSRYSYQLLNRYLSAISDYNLIPAIQIRDVSSDKQTLSNYFSKISTDLENLLAIQKNITSYQEGYTENFPYEIKELELTVKQKEEDLKEAQEKLNDYYLYAPFEGIISSVNVKKGDFVSSQTTVANLITQEKIIEAPFNEIDIVQIKEGQKAKITFDALEDQVFQGKVIEISPTGSESQGVVSYDVKIALEEDNENIKPAMTANVEIIVAEKENVLIVPNSAIKTLNGKNYVEVSPEKLPPSALKTGVTLTTPLKRVFIELGLTSDLYSEVVKGLEEGDYIVISTVSSKTSTPTTTQRSFFMGQGFNPQRMR